MKRILTAFLIVLLLLLAGCAPGKDVQSDYDRGYDDGYEEAMQNAEDKLLKLNQRIENLEADLRLANDENLDDMRDAYDWGYDDGINGREYGYSY